MPPVAANDGGKSSSKSQTSTSSNQRATKICHLIKRPDFDGYGFNLHTEKSKPGQYIGKVDANSPAEVAGLREGFRILEVNGIPVNNETHKQVVQRIKAIAWEVKLLVSTDEIENASTDESSRSNHKESSSLDEKHQSRKDTGNGKTSLNNEAATADFTSATKSKENVPHTNGKNSNKSEMLSSKSAAAMTSTISTTQPPPPSAMPKFNDPTAHGSATQSSVHTTSSLRLPSTAAEMRAILQSKKKLNPKDEEVNLQKKYEIIQKL